MCTLTIIEQPAGYRVVVNRDEKRSRPAATPPEERLGHGRRALWPVDTLAGGTWIAVTDRGLTLSVQNVNPTPPLALPPVLVSRGEIIPRLMGARTARDAASDLRRLHLDLHAPFRLVAIDDTEIAEAVWDRTSLAVKRQSLGPACFVSSGLGDCLAAPRIDLWDLFLAEHGATPRMQDEFHRHAWPDRPEISVRMSRADARTISTTTVDVRFGAAGAEATMIHRDDAGAHHASLDAPTVAGVVGRAPAVAARATGGDHRGAW